MPAYFAWWRQRFVYIAFVLVAVLAVLPLAAPGFIAVGDAWLWLAIWLSSACVLYVIARQPPVHYRGIWLVLITAFLALLIQNYQEFKSTQNRLTQLHSDLSRRAADLQTLNLENRRNAQTLARDLNDWSVADDTTRTIKENTVASDLNLLQGGIRDADSRMQELHLLIREKASDPATTSVATTTTAATTTTTPTTTSGEQPVTAFRRSMLDPAVNLAQDSARATGAMVASLQLVQDTWDSNRSTVSHQALIDSVNPGLWVAIDAVESPVTRLQQAVTDATDVPVGDVVLVIMILNLALVLFPSLLVLLFIAGRRDIRLRQIYMDLWDLGGGTNKLLVRTLERTSHTELTDIGYTNPNVRRELQDRTFSNVEYLLCLIVLTLILAGAWHLIIYPTGELGVVELFAQGVSVDDFVTHVVSNLNVVTLGFLGAYFFSIGVLIRRFFATDLYPAAFLQMIYRLLVVVVISLFLSIVVPLLLSLPGVNTLPDNVAGLPTRPMAGGSLSGQVAIAGTLAFFFAVFFGQFTPWLSRVPALLRVRGLDRGKPDKNLHAPVSKLEGVDLWVESRLAEESVETVQAMAGVPIDKLVRRTYFSTAQIVCWVDQAILYMHAGNSGEWMTAFRKAGIHKGTDLLRAIGYGDALTQIDLPQDAIIRPVVDLDKVNNAVMTLVAAADVKSADDDEPEKGDKSDGADKTDKTAEPGKTDKPDAKPPKLTGPTVFEIAAAVWAEPNLEYLVNFYNAHKVNIRPRPSAGTVPSPQPAPEKPVAVA